MGMETDHTDVWSCDATSCSTVHTVPKGNVPPGVMLWAARVTASEDGTPSEPLAGVTERTKPVYACRTAHIKNAVLAVLGDAAEDGEIANGRMPDLSDDQGYASIAE